MKRKSALILALILFLGGALAFFATGTLNPAKHGVKPMQSTGKALIGGAFSLTDHNGKKVSEKDYTDKYMLVYFGYTFCPDVCPTELQAISEALELMGEQAEQVTPIFVSVDPARDGVKEMNAYVKAFDKRLVGLTGSPEEIANIAKAYRVYYSKVVEKDAEDSKDYAMDHSAIVYLMDRKGEYAAHFTYGTKPKTMADKISAILEKAKAGG